jgi:hypothetical protein
MTDRYKTRKKMTVAIIAIVLILLAGYTSYEIRRVAYGPRITVLSPTNGSVSTSSLIEISGVAQNIKDISLNDRKIFIDEQGNFKEEVLLSPGYNILTFKASDKFGKETEKVIEIIYTQSSSTPIR